MLRHNTATWRTHHITPWLAVCSHAVAERRMSISQYTQSRRQIMARQSRCVRPCSKAVPPCTVHSFEMPCLRPKTPCAFPPSLTAMVLLADISCRYLPPMHATQGIRFFQGVAPQPGCWMQAATHHVNVYEPEMSMTLSNIHVRVSAATDVSHRGQSLSET
jgi:hypothetical protein